MIRSKPDKIERSTRILVSRLLRTGVLTASVVIFIGGILFFVQHPSVTFAYGTFTGEPERLRNAATIIREAFGFRSRAVIQFGILILISTPVLRVIFSLTGFAIEKDRVFVIITGVVLIVLLYSLLG
jgi:uncharacterized membrane protein